MAAANVLTAISFSHHNTELDERDALAFTARDTDLFVEQVRQNWKCEAAVLATCNRTEFYLYGPALLDLWSRLKPLVADIRQIKEDTIPTPALFTDDGAIRHLFRVAAGLESIAIGENQILGQIGDVHDYLLNAARKSPILCRLFHFAVRTGKRVRTETSLCEGSISISSAAVDLALKIFGSFAHREILIVGAGETAEKAAMHFRSSGAERFAVLNRSRKRGEEVAQRINGKYRPLSELTDACTSADVALFATGAQDFLLTEEQMRAIMKARARRPIFLIDISNPRNIDPQIARYDSAFLYNIDDLQQVVQANLATRKNEIPAVEAIIEYMLAEWRTWKQSLYVTPTITSLVKFFEEIRAQELIRHEGSLSESERAMLDDFSKSLIKKLLHNPIMYLRGAVRDEILRSEDLELVWALYKLPLDQKNDHDP